MLYQQQAAKAGITLNIVREPSDGYWTQVARKKPWYTSYWSGRASEDTMFTVAYSGGNPLNDTHWNHDEFNKLLVAASLEADEAKRRPMFYELQRSSAMRAARSCRSSPTVSTRWPQGEARGGRRWELGTRRRPLHRALVDRVILRAEPERNR